MKTFKMISVMLISLVLMSCEKDFQPVDSVKSTFTDMYPDATRIEWEIEYGYYVVEFRYDNKEKTAWFDQQGVWWLTETDIPKSQLPNAISQAIAAGSYSSWRIDDIDYIEKRDETPFYVVELELNDRDVDLVYLEDGTFVGESHDGEHNTP